MTIEEMQGQQDANLVNNGITNGFAVTPSNSEDLPYYTRGVYVGVSGNLKVVLRNGAELTFVGLAAGVVHPLQCKKIFATGTTATSILGLV